MTSSTLNDIINKYKQFLKDKYHQQLKLYLALEDNDPDAATFEAICYSILRSRGLSVNIAEQKLTGGPDFFCSGNGWQFVAEATTINTTSMENKTGMENDQSYVEGGFYRAYPTVWQKLNQKVRQLSKYKLPGILVIGSFHSESMTLFRDVLADEYLSAFFNKKESFDALLSNSHLRAISAFALIGFNYNEYSCAGFLNPSPMYPFNLSLLPDISFRRVTARGVAERTGEGEWVSYKSVISHTSQFRYPLKSIR